MFSCLASLPDENFGKLFVIFKKEHRWAAWLGQKYTFVDKRRVFAQEQEMLGRQPLDTERPSGGFQIQNLFSNQTKNVSTRLLCWHQVDSLEWDCFPCDSPRSTSRVFWEFSSNWTICVIYFDYIGVSRHKFPSNSLLKVNLKAERKECWSSSGAEPSRRAKPSQNLPVVPWSRHSTSKISLRAQTLFTCLIIFIYLAR